MQNPEIARKTKSRYEFEELNFDSAPELAFYIWLKDNNIEFEYQPNEVFEYQFENKICIYQPDFKIGDLFFELKDDHFFKLDGTMCNPYNHSQDGKYEAKHQCMLSNNVIILRSKDYKMFEIYAKLKYGKDWVKKFKQI